MHILKKVEDSQGQTANRFIHIELFNSFFNLHGEF